MGLIRLTLLTQGDCRAADIGCLVAVLSSALQLRNSQSRESTGGFALALRLQFQLNFKVSVLISRLSLLF